MISFENIKQDPNKNYLFFLPEPLKAEVIRQMRKDGIEARSRNWKDFAANPRDPYDSLPEYKEAIDLTRSNFEKMGYKNTTCIGAIVSHVPSNVLWGKCGEFYGQGIDPDYEQARVESQIRSDRTYEECYKDWLPEGTIPVAGGR